MKKTFAVFLAAALLLSCAAFAAEAEDGLLRAAAL